MFYRPEDGHGLPHNPFNAIVTPRPIGWIATRGADGSDNLAPYSFFNAVAYEPPQVMFSSTSTKPDRFDHAKLRKADCDTINCPRVADAPATLECKVTQIIKLEGAANFAVFGEVSGIHMRDDCLVDGTFDVTRFQPLARLGYKDYAAIGEIFSLSRPTG